MERILVSFFIVILICSNIEAVELLLSSSLEKNPTRQLTPCDTNADCEEFLNGECRDNFCECNGTKFCEEKSSMVVTKIGQFCKINADCNIEHAVCKADKCTCKEGRVSAPDERRCLELAEALGSTCEESIQCSEKVPHSGCRNEKCVCQQQMHEYQGACFRDVALGDDCQLPGECSATEYARCTDHKCTCKADYVQSQTANKCLDIPTKINGPCYETIQCSTKFGKAFCTQGHCQCEELYQFKHSRSMCVRDLLLGEVCQNHTDCRGPEIGESRSECILGVCKCRSEFHEEHGFCIKHAYIGLSLSNTLKLKELNHCIAGKCDCEEERRYCSNSVNNDRTATQNKVGDDDLSPRKVGEVMISDVFWTYNIFLYVYWQISSDDQRLLLRKYMFPFLILYFHGFTDNNFHHIWISEVLAVFGMLARAVFL